MSFRNLLSRLRLALALLVFAGSLVGCTTQVLDARRIKPLDTKPTAISFIWVGAKGPTSFSNLPSLSVAMRGASDNYLANYRSEQDLFIASLEPKATRELAFKTSSFVALPYFHTAAQLHDEVKRAPESAAIVEMYTQRVVSYCTPGCYAFKVRVDYLAPGNRSRVWTALFDLPPKAMHSDPFDSVTEGFVKALAQKLAAEQLLP